MNLTDEDYNRMFLATVIVLVSIAALVIIYIVAFRESPKTTNGPLIEGYMSSYFYGYKDGELVFEITTTTESGGKGKATVYVINPSQKDNIMRYNNINTEMHYFISEKSLYEIKEIGEEDND